MKISEARHLTHTISDREAATILAALRNFQIDAMNEDMQAQFPDHFSDYTPLDNDEIDALCEAING
jgi:hypothetical protein